MTAEPRRCTATIQGKPCDRPVKIESLGLCGLHYSRHNRGTGMDVAVKRQPPVRRKCSDCGASIRATSKTGQCRACSKARRPTVCTVEGCDRTHQSSGLCGMHYARRTKTGDVGPVGSLIPERFEGKCHVDGCTEPIRTRKWCAIHYQRWLRTDDPTKIRRKIGRSPCSIEDCDKPVAGRGLCSTHWAAAKRRGEFSTDPCAVEGCERISNTRGWCVGHYKRWLNYGDPEAGIKAFRGTVSTSECAVDGCNRQAVVASSGERLCKRHHSRWLQHGDARVDIDDRIYYDTDMCTIEGCGRDRVHGAHCRPHHLRKQRYGDPRAGGRFMDEIPDTCTIEGCDKGYYALDCCQKHYNELPHRKEWNEEYTRRPKVRRANAERAMRREALKRTTAVVYPIPIEALEGRVDMMNGRCWICGEHLDPNSFHLDHVKPIASNGPHVASNLRPACSFCNTSKGADWPVDTAARVVRLDPARLP